MSGYALSPIAGLLSPMRSLSGTLTAAQKAATRTPAITAVLWNRPQTPNNPRRLRWANYYDGAENDDPIAAAIATDGSLVRIRANGTTIEHNRVASPGSGSTYSTWSTLATGQTDGPVALAAGPSGELIALWTKTSGTVLVSAVSTDNGATWGSPSNLVTEGAAIASIAVTFHRDSGSTPSDAAAFYVVSNGAKILRRTSGSWAGSGTAWTLGASVTTLTGIAATHGGGDFYLAFTGTDTDGNPRLWTNVVGNENLPPGAWGSLVVVQEADADSTVTFSHPALDYSDNGHTLTFTRKEAGNVADTRTYATQPTDGINAQWWFEPWPTAASSTAGAAICRDSSDETWLATSSQVYHAPYTATLDVAGQLLAFDIRFALESTRATVELDQTIQTGVQDYAGGSIRLALGYTTSAGNEYGNSIDLHIDSVDKAVVRGRRFATLHCSGPWEAARATHAQQAWSRDAAAMSRANIFDFLAARARIDAEKGTTSSNWSNIKPAFAWQAGESVYTAAKRLLRPAEEAVRADEGYFRVLSRPTSSSYDYGPSDHPVDALTVTTAPAPANWLRLEGIDRYADAFESPEVDTFGPRFAILRSLEADDDTKTADFAAAALDEHLAEQPYARLRAAANVGQEMFDIVTLADDYLPVPTLARVIGLRYIFDRALKGPRFDIELDLAIGERA